MPFFQRNEQIALWYLDEGATSAPTMLTMLLIHGLSCSLHDWNWQVPFLLDIGYRVVTLDVRGHGRSSAPKPTPGITSWPGKDADPSIVDYYPQTCAYDAAALLEHLAIKSAIVMGHSQGDLIGYFLATDRPDLVCALVGVDPIHRWDNAMREANAGFFEPPAGCIEKMIGFFSMTYPAGSPAWEKTWHARRCREMDPDVFFALCWGGWGDQEFGLGRKEVAVATFGGKLKCPRLTFGCDEEAVRVDRSELPRGSEADEVLIVGGKGHWLQQTDDNHFNAELERWLKKIGMSPALKAV